ncbi:uncharacterized protein F5891DRAFT_1193678 [Suillus fuscotomentosus]|uniref:Uncharacterized protein n=1 Tax=Suillus fuscotomentosus TaxID=1912939 RepID=A0AAD4DZS7_9AGAM|nr:uncharacterized protein F5891DRAFT_1193678 [Suillus fuscotomentosus]KAG1895864.1 hypothetical protein F5891DRAFT_1193678 [Suillus fuscotomentosus]
MQRSLPLPEPWPAAAASESSNNDYDDSDDFKLSLDLAYGQSHDDRSSDWKALPYPSHDDRSQHSHIFPGAQGDLALANPTSFSNADLYTSSSPRESEPSFHSDSVAHQASLAGVPGLQTISDSFSMDRRQGQSQLYRQQEAQNYEDWVALSNSSRIWLPYNVPGSRSTFLGTQHLDPNKFYANCYSPQEPGPFQPYSDLVTHQAPSEPRVANSFSVDRSQSQQLQRQWDAQSHDDDRREALLGRSQSTSGWSPYNISASGSHTSPGTQHLALADPTSFGADSHTSSSSREPGPSKSHSDSVTHQVPSGTPADRVSGVEIDTRLLTVPRLNISLPLHWFNPYCRPGAVQASRDPILLDSNLEMVGPSHSVTVTPPPLPLRRGLYSLPMLLLRSREHFTCFIFNDRDGFLMDADTLKGHARRSLDATFGQNNRKCLELLDLNG